MAMRGESARHVCMDLKVSREKTHFRLPLAVSCHWQTVSVALAANLYLANSWALTLI